jgi:RNA polymerase sigma-70 factor (ECF subfamily)
MPLATEHDFEQYRKELTGYCYRMLGSGFEAEDAVQETMVRAWKAIDGFEGRSSLRSWLYRIATNVCLDMGQASQRRARPMDMGPVGTAEPPLAPAMPENTWVTPIADDRVLPEGDPAEVAAARESIRLAFVSAIQTLPPKQRAVLILREVLRWQATEVAELLGTTVASVNSALQRARATLSEGGGGIDDAPATVAADQEAMLSRYVDAFERYDIDSLVSLLHDDAVFSMPPFPLWLVGPEQVDKFMWGIGAHCQNSKTLPVPDQNGCPAFACYHSNGDGTYSPWSIVVLEVADGRIAGVNNFLDTNLFELNGLPAAL